MKIAITATSPNLDAALDPRCGRAEYFILVDPQTLEWQAHANPAVNAPGGAGSRAAQMLSQLGANAVLSGDFGPNAFDALQAAGIEMYRFGEQTNARQALEAFQAGELTAVGNAGMRGRYKGRGAR